VLKNQLTLLYDVPLSAPDRRPCCQIELLLSLFYRWQDKKGPFDQNERRRLEYMKKRTD
jgi:hypothetical protein